MFVFSVYKKDKNPYASNIVPCMDFQNNTAEGKVCDVPMTDSWHPCLEERGFGFNDPKGGPCIFLKLNKVNCIRKWYEIKKIPNKQKDRKIYIHF